MDKEEYMTLEEASEELGMKRATFYNYMSDLKIKAQKFGRDRHGYISHADVQRLREYKENPWKIGAKKDRKPRKKTKANIQQNNAA